MSQAMKYYANIHFTDVDGIYTIQGVFPTKEQALKYEDLYTYIKTIEFEI